MSMRGESWRKYPSSPRHNHPNASLGMEKLGRSTEHVHGSVKGFLQIHFLWAFAGREAANAPVRSGRVGKNLPLVRRAPSLYSERTGQRKRRRSGER